MDGRYGTVEVHAEVSPDSKPSAYSGGSLSQLLGTMTLVIAMSSTHHPW
jgi:hypothetical protein